MPVWLEEGMSPLLDCEPLFFQTSELNQARACREGWGCESKASQGNVRDLTSEKFECEVPGQRPWSGGPEREDFRLGVGIGASSAG